MPVKPNKYGLVEQLGPKISGGKVGSVYTVTSSTTFPPKDNVLGWDVSVKSIGTYGVVLIGTGSQRVRLGWDDRGQAFRRFYPASQGHLEVEFLGMRDESWGPVTVKVVGR